MSGLLGRLQVALAERYSIERELGHGGMATVYLAEDLKHRRLVALKVLSPDLAASLGTDRFLREIDIARALGVGGVSGVTGTGIAVGTPGYMSPEQARGVEQPDGRSDLYSLGCVLYEMLAGDPPFTGWSAQSILARQAAEPVPRLHTVRDTVPDWVEQAVTRALAKAPAGRVATAPGLHPAPVKPT